MTEHSRRVSIDLGDPGEVDRLWTTYVTHQRQRRRNELLGRAPDRQALGAFLPSTTRPLIAPPSHQIESAARHLISDSRAAGGPVRLSDALARLAEHFADLGCDWAAINAAFANVLDDAA